MPERQPPPDPLAYESQPPEPTFAQTLGLYVAVFCLTGLLLAIAAFVFVLVTNWLVHPAGIH